MIETDTTVVLTTINPPNPKIGKWAELSENNVIVVGDNKTPNDWKHKGCDFISIGTQKEGEFEISKCLLENHYTRKNIGYLYALKNGASMILDTDDDNFPYLEKWTELMRGEKEPLYLEDQRDLTYKNVYTHFSESNIPFWPRGFPLNKLTLENSLITPNELVPAKENSALGLWQCMVDGDPDIDAIHRLIFKKTPTFVQKSPILFGKNNLCSFNSQNTLWMRKSIFPLLYLPATVSFRFTDILRSYVAQIILDRAEISFGFYPSTSYQERNDHNLMLDFESETSMYQRTEEIVTTLDGAVRQNVSIGDNLINAYSSLLNIDVVDPLELKVIDCWLADMAQFIT